MCGRLMLTCQREGDFKAAFNDHFLIHPQYHIPCNNPGSEECKACEAELIDFQNPPTSCAGAKSGYGLESEEGRKACMKSLERYGAALYHVNTAGPKKKSAWYAWLKSWLVAKTPEEAAPLLKGSESDNGSLSWRGWRN